MIKHKILSSLVLFFLASVIFAQFEITWEQEKAIAVSFPDLTGVQSEDLKIYLAGSDRPIFGQWQNSGSIPAFKPVIAFSQGEDYELRDAEVVLFEFSIEIRSTSETKLIQFYPDCDTVPANLLKIHLQFSGPMGELLSEQFLKVTSENGDTLQKIFLPLQPELWNETRDQLTLWLDPGRIKRELGPNLWLGAPLQENNQYIIDISRDWKDQHSQPLQKGVQKIIFAGKVDRTKPDPAHWSLQIPPSGTQLPLQIHFHESMDYVLANECLSIVLTEPVEGRVSLENHQQIWNFAPNVTWKKGRYQVRIEGRLEDLAGNNLNRLFEEDIRDRSQINTDQDLHYLTFEIP